MFFPILINTPWVYHQINKFLLHLLGEYFSKKNNLFVKCVFIPIIYNQCFYFAVDRKKLLYFKPMFTQYKLFSHIFENFPSFETIFNNINQTKFNLQPYMIKNFSTCSTTCLCHYCQYKSVNNVDTENTIILKRLCCPHH